MKPTTPNCDSLQSSTHSGVGGTKSLEPSVQNIKKGKSDLSYLLHNVRFYKFLRIHETYKTLSTADIKKKIES